MTGTAGASTTPGSRCNAGHTTHTPYTSSNSRSAAGSLATPFCTHTTDTDAGALDTSALSASPVCWLFMAMSTTSSSRKSSPAGCDTTGIDSVSGSASGMTMRRP